MLFNKNSKKQSFFVVVNKDRPEQFLTVTCTKKDAFDYTYKYLKILHFEHYAMWCDLRNLNTEDETVWYKYFNDCIPLEEKCNYFIKKVTYKLNDIAAILRMFGGCIPIGCSFDTDTEYQYLNYKMEAHKTASDFVGTLKDTLEKMEKEKKETDKKDGK